MTPAFALLAECQQRQVHLTIDGERLNVDAPSAVLTDELLGRLKIHKPALAAMLRQGLQPTLNETVDTLPANGQDFFDNCDELIDPPDACPNCKTLELWQNLPGDWRCLKCDPPTRWREFVRQSRILK